MGVVAQQSDADVVQCRLDRGDLGEDVDAVAVVFNHASDPADLALDALQANEEVLLRFDVAGS